MKNLLEKITRNCPFGERLTSCPVCKINVQEKCANDIIDNLENSKTDKMISLHRECLGRRYENLLKESHTEHIWNNLLLA